jgi:hypothetical protein
MRISKTMKNNQYYVLFLALLAFSAQPTFGMESPKARLQDGLDRNTILEQLQLSQDDAKIEFYADAICNAALQKTGRGRIYFHVPYYERYLNSNPEIPWQALFMANASMIETITTQRTTATHQGRTLFEIPPAQFKHLQQAVIYCETAREFLKRQNENNPGLVSIAALKKFTFDTYEKAYRHEPTKLRSAQHVAQHRWGNCSCSALFTPRLARNK